MLNLVTSMEIMVEKLYESFALNYFKRNVLVFNVYKLLSHCIGKTIVCSFCLLAITVSAPSAADGNFKGAESSTPEKVNIQKKKSPGRNAEAMNLSILV